MHKSKLVYFIVPFFVTIVISVVYVTFHISHQSQRDSIIEQAKIARDTHMKERLSRPFGKIEIPAEVYIGLVESEKSRNQTKLVISAATLNPTELARIILIKSQTGFEPEHRKTLWADTPDDIVDKTIIYNAGDLPVGKHQYHAVLEFMSGGNNPKLLVSIGSLFLDVRPDEILSSNVSFGQIERLELHKELQKRVMVSMKPQLKNANSKIMAQEMKALEDINPGFFDREIQDMIASDPDIARRVEEINMSEDEPLQTSGAFNFSNKSNTDANDIATLGGNYKPISDVEVPVPEEFRK